jgi:hypothetical protein
MPSGINKTADFAKVGERKRDMPDRLLKTVAITLRPILNYVKLIKVNKHVIFHIDTTIS